jgi:hypothetical protein
MLLKILEKLGRKRLIYDRDNQEVYMERYYLCFQDKLTEAEAAQPLPFNFMLHKICLSDPDDLHDHPWWYATLILGGGYWEITPTGRYWRGPGHFRISSPQSLHRIEVQENPSWSLFWRGPKLRDWGFVRQGKWIDHKTYLQQRQEKA